VELQQGIDGKGAQVSQQADPIRPAAAGRRYRAPFSRQGCAGMHLPMNVSTDSDRRLYWLHCALLEHNLLHVLAQVLQVALWDQLALAHERDPLV
jgi:hypothetical protein